MSDISKDILTPDDTRAVLKHFWQVLVGWLKRRFRRSSPQTEPQPTEPLEPEKGILIIGPGGTGKTTFAKLISGQLLPWVAGGTWEYEESVGEETFELTDRPNVELVVPAGQLSRREVAWADVTADLASGRYAGVVFVAAFGHHSYSSGGYQSLEGYRGKKADFLPIYAAAKRAEELAAFEFLLPGLRAAPDKLWLLTLVTKEDLWWKSSDESRDFYTSGKWAEMVAGLSASRGSKQFWHEWCPVSLTISNLRDPEGAVLFQTTAGYDIAEQAKSLARLGRAFDAFRQWEEQP